jgi:dynamin 1-like protein
MDQLIPVINKLQDVFNTTNSDPVDLPQIVVVGSQSSGKSSVLENIVGRDFLPRGTGIVTRRPLILQLINLPTEVKSNGEPEKEVVTDQYSEWGEFLHLPNQMFYDFNEIRGEIIKETDRIAGKKKSVSNAPINLKIYSPNVLNLTLVDLPGITRVPIDDQPHDIELQIKQMVMQYIEKQNALILAVTSANTDLSTSDALALAREVDPEGLRTIGVLTKLDLMDKGTDALDILTGKLSPLKLGYVGVVNRSQQNIIDGISIKDALKRETEFFRNHLLYKSISSRCGTPYLARTLNRILLNHIRNCLPDLRNRINQMMLETQQELSMYGDPTTVDSKTSQGGLLLQIITKFCKDYNAAIEGKSAELSTTEISGGARISFIFHQVFSKALTSIQPTEGLSLNDIRTAIRNATGPKPSLFVPEVSFEVLVKRQIQRLEEPSIQCAELVFEELHRLVYQVADGEKELDRFSVLRDRIIDVAGNLLRKSLSPTRIMIGNLINIELAYINTNHPDFIGGQKAMANLYDKSLTEPQAPTIAAATNASGSRSNALPPPPNQRSQTAIPPTTAKAPERATGMPDNNADKGYLMQYFFGDNKSASVSNPQSAPRQPLPQKPVQNGKRSDGIRLDQVPNVLRATEAPTEKEKVDSELIQSLLGSYFTIVRKNIQDTIPKSIVHFLVNQTKELIQNELVAALYKEDCFLELLKETDNISAKRKKCVELLDILKKASSIVSEVSQNIF